MKTGKEFLRIVAILLGGVALIFLFPTEEVDNGNRGEGEFSECVPASETSGGKGKGGKARKGLVSPVSQGRPVDPDSGKPGVRGKGTRKSLVERYYAEAARLGVTETTLPDGKLERVTLLRTDLKYSLVRVVDRLGPVTSSGERVVRSSIAMAAGHVLVDPAEAAGTTDLRARLEKTGWRVRAELGQSGNLLAALPSGSVADPSRDAFPTFRKRLERDLGALATVEPDYLYYPSGLADDPFFSDGSLWGLRNQGQAGGKEGADIRAVEAWDLRNDASEVVVAVIDTGLRMTHEDIAANLWTNPAEIPGNGIDDDGNGVVDDVHGFDAIDGGGEPSDEDGHGTHVAGTIGAAGNNATGATGVAWRVQLMPIRFLGADGGFLSDAIEGIAYAQANGAAILNNSWGGGGFSIALREAIADLATEDRLFVAAAGNDGVDSDETPGYPAAYDLPHILSVAASDRNDRRAAFSNFGAVSVDLAAPGASIRSTFNGGDASYATLSGTSMASPHVAGALALLRAEFPDEDAASLKARLLDTVDVLEDFTGETVSGGRLNLEAALLNEAAPRPGVLRFATDRVNAAENGGSLPVVIRRSGGSDGPVSVRYRTVAESATAGADFIAVEEALLTWADGEAADRTISVALVDDDETEGTESFALELFAAGGEATIGSPGRLRIDLLDDEAASLEGFEFTEAFQVSANFALSEPAPTVAATPDGGYVWAEIEFTNAGVELLLRRYAADGSLLWERGHFAGGGVFRPRLTVAADGRVFVGYSRITVNSNGQITEADLAALAFSAEGSLLWDMTLPDPSGALDLVNAVALGEDGGLYLGGEYALVGANDAVLARLDATTGAFSWMRVFKPNPDLDGDDAVSSLAPDGVGGVWAGGWTVGTNGFEGVLRRYGADGNMAWQRRYPTQGQQRVLDLAANAFGEVYASLRAFDNVTGVFSGKLLRLAPDDGAIVWEQNQSVHSSAANFFITASPNGFVDYLQGPDSLAAGTGLYSVGRYDRSGMKLFENNLDGSASLSVTGMAGNVDGEIVFTGAFDGLAQFGGNLIDGEGSVSAYTARLLPQDPVTPGVPVFDGGDLALAEGVGELAVTVRRAGGADGPLRVGLRSVEGTALAGEDFVSLDEVLAFAPGQQTATTTLSLIDDFTVEPAETLRLELYEVDPGMPPGEPAEITVHILNDDFAFEEWLGKFFDPGSPESDEAADPDGDGQSNLLEYAFGGDPRQPGAGPAPSLSLEADGRIRMVYQRKAGREDLRFRPFVSVDLEQWQEPTVLGESVAPASGDRESVTLDLAPPFDATDKAFLQIEVERTTQGVRQ